MREGGHLSEAGEVVKLVHGRKMLSPNVVELSIFSESPAQPGFPPAPG